MNKKFLSAILFGALMVSSTGTFVSCKDYDDDITELWDAVNSQKTDLSSKITAIESSISNLQSAQSGLQSEIAAAKAAAAAAQTAADKAAADAKVAALEAQEAAIKAAAEELAAVKTALEAAIAAGDTKSAEALEAAVVKLEAADKAVAETATAALKEAIAKMEADDKAIADALAEAEKKIEANIAEVIGSIAVLEKAYQGADAEILDKLAAAETTLSDKITALDGKVAANVTAIAELKAALELQQEALENYKEENGAAVEGILERLGKCEDALKALEAFDLELNQKDIDKLKEDYTKIAEEISEKINPTIELLSAAIYTGVTHVSLIASENATVQSGLFDWNLGFESIIEKENVFGHYLNGKVLPSAISFTKNAQNQLGDKIIVRVSPTNANLESGMITLQNSKGETLEIVQITKLDSYKGLLSRAISKGGLWEVEVSLNSYSETSFKKAAYVESNPAKGNILYAVAVNNVKGEDAVNRNVISTYDLTLQHKFFTGLKSLNYFVGTTNVGDIANRTSDQVNLNPTFSLPVGPNAKLPMELEWTGTDIPAVKAIYSLDANGGIDPYKAHNVTEGDDRTFGRLYNAVQGEEITISIAKEGQYDFGNGVVAPSEVKAMYVTLDREANAIESAPSEWNAWNSYKYTGLNQVVLGTTTKISINPGENQSIVDDIIGFRVYAVNWDGTLVDPDGKAFYVRIGAQATNWNDKATTIEASIMNPGTYNSKKENVSLTNLTDADSYTWTTDKCANNENGPIFNIIIRDASGNSLFNSANYNNVSSIKFKDAATIETVPTCGSWLDYKDNKAYNGKLTIKNAKGFVLATLNVSMTKTLPQGMPAGYSLKDKQVINGIYNCYMIAADNSYATYWNAPDATKGKMPIENLINFGSGDYSVNGASYYVIFNESAADSDQDGKLDNVKANGDSYVGIAKGFIDNVTEHATTVYYNYGKISTETKNGNGQIIDYVKTGDSFKTVYCCFYKKGIHEWSWATRAQATVAGGTDYTEKDENGNYKEAMPSTTLTYGVSPATKYNAFVYGKNAIDGTFSKLLNAVYASSLKVVSAKLTSDATGKVDYFSVDTNLQFTAIKDDLGSNPKANVPSTLTVTCKDSYNHTVEFTLKMTVAPRQ